MGILIDTSVLIEYERGRIDLNRHLAGREEEQFFLSVITASELLHGVHRARADETRARRAALVESVLERFPILPLVTGNLREFRRVPGLIVESWVG